MPLAAEALKLADESLWSTIGESMQKTNAGKDMYDLIKNNFVPMYHSLREQGFKQAAALPKHLQPEAHEIDSIAKNTARLKVLGQNDYKAVGLVKAVKTEFPNSPLQAQMHQQALADNVHMFLRDTIDTTMKDTNSLQNLPQWQKNKILADKNIGLQSKFKMNVKKALAKEGDTLIDSSAKYHPRGEIEKTAVNLASRPMLFGIVVPHIGTLANYALLGTNLTDLAKGFAQATFDNKNVRGMVADHGIFASTLADAYAVRYNGSRGIIARAARSDNFGVIVNQMSHQPGFNALREWTLSVGAATGKLQADRFTRDLLQSRGTDKIAIHNLKRHGIMPQDILASGGMNPDQLRQFIFNWVDSRVFLDNTLHRTFNSQRFAATRLGGMYHGYITRQGQLIKEAIIQDVYHRNNGLVATAQTLGMLGLVFPTVGIGLKTLSMWGRGQFNTNAKQDYEDLAFQRGPTKALEAYADGVGHMAAFGVASDYMRSTLRHQLIQSAAGPIGNEVANLGQDTVGAFAHFDSDDPNKSLKPLERDLLADIIPGLGKIMAHQLLPTKKEIKANHPSSRLQKMKSAKMKRLSRLN